MITDFIVHFKPLLLILPSTGHARGKGDQIQLDRGRRFPRDLNKNAELSFNVQPGHSFTFALRPGGSIGHGQQGFAASGILTPCLQRLDDLE